MKKFKKIIPYICGDCDQHQTESLSKFTDICPNCWKPTKNKRKFIILGAKWIK